IQAQNLWTTVYPYIRIRMAHGASHAPWSQPSKELHGDTVGEITASNSTMYGWRPPFQLGEALDGGAIGEVAASDDPRFKPGDLVSSWFGWREWYNAPTANLQKLDTFGLPPQAFLGVAGMPGLTAWVGLLKIAMLKRGDAVFVSAASGADGPRNIMFVMGKSLRLEGFNIANYLDLMPEFQREMSGWIHEGKITWKETIEHGIENAPTAFLKLFKGENFGKMLVKLR